MTLSETDGGGLPQPAPEPSGGGAVGPRDTWRPSPPPDLATLIGLRSSKPTFYAEYRHTAASLDRTLRSFDRIMEVLATTNRGAEPLCQEIVETTADYLSAQWVVL